MVFHYCRVPTPDMTERVRGMREERIGAASLRLLGQRGGGGGHEVLSGFGPRRHREGAIQGLARFVLCRVVRNHYPGRS